MDRFWKPTLQRSWFGTVGEGILYIYMVYALRASLPPRASLVLAGCVFRWFFNYLFRNLYEVVALGPNHTTLNRLICLVLGGVWDGTWTVISLYCVFGILKAELECNGGWRDVAWYTTLFSIIAWNSPEGCVSCIYKT
jgi:hypothetical protein